MRICLIAAVLITGGITALAADKDPDGRPAACECRTEDIQRLGLGAAIEEVRGPRFTTAMRILGAGAGGTPNVIDCNAAACPVVDVRVIEIKETGTCEAWLDYCRICVTKEKALIRFRLVDGNGKPLNKNGNYAFDTSKPGIEIDNATGGGKTHFKDPVRESDEVRFRWRTAGDNTLGLVGDGLPHRARVVRKQPSASCEPKDPIIVNAAN